MKKRSTGHLVYKKNQMEKKEYVDGGKTIVDQEAVSTLTIRVAKV